MDDFSQMFQKLQNSRNSDENWIYTNPVTGKTHEGIGQGPMPWGQYPENMDEDSEEARTYDMYRGEIRPLPSDLFQPGGVEDIQNLEEGSQLEDPMWVTASRTLHKYLEAPGRKETGPMRLAPPSKREMDFDEYAAWGVKFINAFENNTVAMAVNTAQLMDAPPEVSQAMYYLLETGDRSGVLASNIGRAALNMATDPLMWVGLGTLGIGTAGKFAGQKMSKMAFKEILKKNMLSKTTAVVGTEGALYGAVYDLARQNVGVNAGVRDGFDLGQTAVSTAIGGGAGALLAGVAPGGVEAARRGLVSLGEGAKARMADGGSQLNTGIDIDPLLAKAGELVSDESDEIKPEVDYEGFYSQALEVTKGLNQKKGTGQQFKSMLLKNGVKQDEIDWLGLDEVFSKGKVTKDEIEQHIRDNRIEIDNVTLTGEPEDQVIDFEEPYILTPDEVYGPEYGSEQMFEQYLDGAATFDEIKKSILDTGFDEATKAKTIARAQEVYHSDGILNLHAQFEPDETAVLEEAGNRLYNEIYYENKEMQFILKVDRKHGYAITGNDDLGYMVFTDVAQSKDYKNGLLEEPVYSLDEAQIQLEMIKMDEGLMVNDYESTKFSEYTQPGGENYQEVLLRLPNDGIDSLAHKRDIDYSGDHFDESNIIAHMRLKDRQTNAGEKVLYVEEIQSDWGQQGRNRGFALPLNAERDKLEKELVDVRREHKKAADEMGELIRSLPDRGEPMNIPRGSENISPSRIELENSAYFKELKAKRNKLSMRMGEIGGALFGPPQAPFVTDTDKWTQLALKKLLVKATKEGDYDYIAISPGRVQFERWNNEGLRNYYDKIIPKNAQKIVKKLDKDALGDVQVEIPSDNLGSQNSFAIKLTDKLKEKVRNGQALFSVPGAVAAGALASQGENNVN